MSIAFEALPHAGGTADNHGLTFVFYAMEPVAGLMEY